MRFGLSICLLATLIFLNFSVKSVCTVDVRCSSPQPGQVLITAQSSGDTTRKVKTSDIRNVSVTAAGQINDYCNDTWIFYDANNNELSYSSANSEHDYNGPEAFIIESIKMTDCYFVEKGDSFAESLKAGKMKLHAVKALIRVL